jgi:hypothetical protein
MYWIANYLHLAFSNKYLYITFLCYVYIEETPIKTYLKVYAISTLEVQLRAFQDLAYKMIKQMSKFQYNACWVPTNKTSSTFPLKLRGYFCIEPQD